MKLITLRSFHLTVLFLLIFSHLSTANAQSTNGIAQTDTIRLRVLAILFDKDLNQKPVPKLGLKLRKVDQPGDSGDVEIKTGLDGQCEVDLAPGQYRLVTPTPVDFQGKSYSWEFDIEIKPGMKVLELSNDNAQSTTLTSAMPVASPARRVDDMTENFKRHQTSVVTIWSENGHGSGFFIDKQGLLSKAQKVH